MKQILLALSMILLLGQPITTTASTGPTSAHTVIQQILATNSALMTYRARVHISLHMLNFPYLSPRLDGTTYYQRPGELKVVFDSVPFYMKGFSQLFEDVSNAATWERDQNVVLLGSQIQDGRSLLVLRMTKKIHSNTLEYTDVYIDPTTYQVLRMEWHYRNGGTIAITQSFRKQDGFWVPSGQHATVNIPHIRAVGDATYSEYQMNVALNETIFKSSAR